MPKIKETLDLLCRNAVDVIDRADLESRLLQFEKDKKPLRVKAGFDPSAPDIHLGHTVLLRKLRQFQDAGHKVVFIIGDYTAMIGDPTGQSKTRPVLSKEQVIANAKTYQEQAFKILDPDPQKIEIVRNSKWLDAPQMLVTFLQISGRVTVDQLLVREDFDKRRKAHRPIAIQELFYPMMQGYDSVAVQADVELGGTDQLFNLLMGREIQSQFGQKPQVVMTMPLLVGLDGTQKMSKSLGNYIAVNDSPKDVFGKAMSVPDTLMATYFDLLTDENGREIAKAVQAGTLHPRDAKVRLSRTLTGNLYGLQEADKQAAEFDRVFRDKQDPGDPDEVPVSEAKIGLADLLKKASVVASTSEAFRLIQQGGVSVDGVKITDPKATVDATRSPLIRAGKKSFFKPTLR